MIQELLVEMLKERDKLTYLGAKLAPERQTHYRREADRLFRVLGACNPFTVDPKKELLAYNELMEKVSEADL